MRKFPHSDTDVRYCKSQNARLLEQNKKLMEQLEQMMSKQLPEQMSKQLPVQRSVSSSRRRNPASTTEEEEDDDEDEDFAQKLSYAEGERKKTLRLRYLSHLQIEKLNPSI